jgi:hypothetical protein
MCERCQIHQELAEEFATRTELGGVGFAVYVVDDDWPEYAYTVGLTGLNHPELVLFGLERWRLFGVLAAYAEDIRDRRRNPLSNGARTSLGEWRFTVVAVPNARQLLPRANAIYGRRFRALQLVYPDVHGVWPWDRRCHLLPGQQGSRADEPQ